MTSIADSIDRSIREAGITRISLAHMLGVSPSTVSAWCNGVTEPPLSRIVQIAQCLNVSPGELIAPANDSAQPASPRIPVVSADDTSAIIGSMPVPSAWYKRGRTAVCGAGGIWICVQVDELPAPGVYRALFHADGALREGYAWRDDMGRERATDTSGAIIPGATAEFIVLYAMTRVSPSPVR